MCRCENGKITLLHSSSMMFDQFLLILAHYQPAFGCLSLVIVSGLWLVGSQNLDADIRNTGLKKKKGLRNHWSGLRSMLKA
jgi:hypothetical protein